MWLNSIKPNHKPLNSCTMKKAYYAILQNKAVITAYLVTIFTLLFIFIVPPIAIKMKYLKILDNSLTNFIVLGACTTFCVVKLLQEGWDWREELIKKVKSIDRKYALAYIGFTVAGITFLLLMQFPLDLKFNPKSLKTLHFVLVVPVCLAQVLSYWVYLPKKLQLFTKSKFGIVILCGIFFTVMHIMFTLKFIFICSIGGVAFYSMYAIFPNVLLMTMSHSTLNIFAGCMGAFNT